MPAKSSWRFVATTTASTAAGLALAYRFPFPNDNALMELIRLKKPWIFHGIEYTYNTMLFTTPCVFLSAIVSLGNVFFSGRKKQTKLASLPPYPDPAQRDELALVIGEMHHPRKPEPTEHPSWFAIPARGLFTGIGIFGAIGSAKTSACMLPFAEQLFGYKADDPAKRIGGLVLEVKGDFCAKVRALLEKCGRTEDYVEISLEGRYRYNPLHNDLDAYALAFGIASLLNNLYGRGKEPFWQQAYTNLVKFIILLHKVVYDYVTLFDVYECTINPELLERRLKEGDRLFENRTIEISVEQFVGDAELEKYPFERVPGTSKMTAPFSEELEAALKAKSVSFEVKSRETQPDSCAGAAPVFEDKRQQFAAVKRWFYQDWQRIDPRLRTSIVEGISVFLSLFDDNPAVKRIFCPPKELYDAKAMGKEPPGISLPSFTELIERGSIVALNFPAAANPGLARIIGTLLKQDFQRAMLTRIARIAAEPGRHHREAVFLCDEYQAFATVGESDPSGDEKFFALSRQAKCIPIVATQSISSLRSNLPGETWRTLLQTFRTKIFLTLSDDFSAQIAAELCGKEAQVKVSYTIAENGQDAGVSVLTGKTNANKATLSASKAYHLQRDFTFEPKIFTELKNAQAIVLAYDGLNPHPPAYVYLKPAHLDRTKSYWHQLERGEL